MTGQGNEKPSDATFLTTDPPYMLRRIIVGSREQFQDLLACFTSNSIRLINKVFDLKIQKKHTSIFGALPVWEILLFAFDTNEENLRIRILLT
ncbi:uncharacterized protein N7529_010771 [Penicillium soppii]|jgi:hypothetical protein|uniref:uncharacterized protein n=1 Tax=Penicillium soppii TaxID=69789 RepID=UPI002549A9FD|nr:uncharacterized protein N7529_010771 [Penicillium soppii]KAJ5851386.1 hypothetical protein N7529_010771 [Penicillium soppii]